MKPEGDRFTPIRIEDAMPAIQIFERCPGNELRGSVTYPDINVRPHDRHNSRDGPHWKRGRFLITIKRLGEFGGFGPDSRESGSNQIRRTQDEVEWVMNEWAIVVMANMAITVKTVQLVRWSSRKAWVVQACQSGRAPDSAMAEPCSGRVSPIVIEHRTSLNPRPWRRTHLTSLMRFGCCQLLEFYNFSA